MLNCRTLNLFVKTLAKLCRVIFDTNLPNKSSILIVDSPDFYLKTDEDPKTQRSDNNHVISPSRVRQWRFIFINTLFLFIGTRKLGRESPACGKPLQNIPY